MRTEGAIWGAVNRRKRDFGLHDDDDESGFVEDSKVWFFQVFPPNTLEKPLKYPGLRNIEVNLGGSAGVSAPSSGLQKIILPSRKLHYTEYAFTQQ